MRAMLIFPLFAVLGGCTTVDGDAPSLLPRPIESRSDAEPSYPAPGAKPDAALDAKVAALSDAVAQAVTRFDAAADRTQATITAAQDAAIGSERWIAAQTALSELDGLRTAVLTPLVALDDLAIARAQAGEPPYPALEAALAVANAADDAQAERLAALDAIVAR